MQKHAFKLQYKT